MAKKKTPVKSEHGGRREGSGKPSFFPGASDEKPWIFRLTKAAKDTCNRRVAELNKDLAKGEIKVSRNAFVEALIRRYGRSFTLDDVRTVATTAGHDLAERRRLRR